ncbi:MAG: GNAT family N-acetyltransferase [Bacteroides sp.]|nr:GNAT family N-acetyltransferase [Bacteroides sp.]
MKADGNFWLAIDNGHVVGTLALMRIDDEWYVLKKFFVRSDYRSKHVGLSLYRHLLDFAISKGVRHIILDTPSVATKSHAFYESSGFVKVDKSDIDVPYEYPDRHSILYKLDL